MADVLTQQTDSALGRDAFLSLLITQLQNQNPLEPQADGEFLAQLAQFSSLESLEGIGRDITALRTLFEAGLGDPSNSTAAAGSTGAGGAATTSVSKGGA